MRRDAVRDRLDRRLGVERDDGRPIRSVACGPTMTTPSELAVASSRGSSSPSPPVSPDITARAFATHGNRRRRRSSPCCSRACCLGEADARDLGIRVDRPRNGRLAIVGLVPRRVLRRDLALAERRVRELPVARDVAGRVDVRDGRAALLVGLDARTRVERDAGRLEADALRRPARDRPRRASGRTRRSPPRRSGRSGRRRSPRPSCTACRGGRRCPRLANALRSSLVASASSCGISVSSISIDRHLGAEALEDRRELAADDSAAEHDEPLGHLGLREQPGRVDAARRVEPGDRRPASAPSPSRRSRS